MKIRIEGCTAEELAEYSPYLLLGKAYEVDHVYKRIHHVQGDTGVAVDALVSRFRTCAHLPRGAKWVEVTE